MDETLSCNAVITIKGTQTDPEGEREVIEFSTEGIYGFDGENYCIVYEESEMTGMEGTTTTVIIKPGFVTLTRDGNVQSVMRFCRGEKDFSFYDTGIVSFSVGISTVEMAVELDLDGGTVHVLYAVEIDHVMTGMNVFDITVRA